MANNRRRTVAMGRRPWQLIAEFMAARLLGAPAPLLPPSLAAYNIRFLSLSQNQKDQWVRKTDNVKWLTRQHELVALLETHEGAEKADLFFGTHIPGVRRFYEQGIAIFVQAE